MRDFTPVRPALWRSKRFRELPCDEARFLFLYLLTNTHQTGAGVYHLPDAYACADLGWNDAVYERHRASLVTAGLILFEASSREILIPKWFAHCAPKNLSHYSGIEKQIARIESERLRMEATDALVASVKGKTWAHKPVGSGLSAAYDLTERLARKEAAR